MRNINVTKKPMNHIVIDLEMTCFMNTKKDKKGNAWIEEGKNETFRKILLNGVSQETIEIGAVMLDSNFEIVKEFQSYVKPSRNPILSGFCRGMTGITQEQIDNAPLFKDAILDFAEWVGPEKFFLYTWSNSDTKRLKADFVNNSCDLQLLHDLTKRTYNLQKDLSVMYNKLACTKGNQLGLKKTLAMLGIVTSNRHHSAIDDAKDTAEILKAISREDFNLSDYVTITKTA